MRISEEDPLTKAERKQAWQRVNNDIRQRWEARNAEYHRELLAAKAKWSKSEQDWLAWVRIKERLKGEQRDREAFWIGYDQFLREGKWQDVPEMRQEAFKRGWMEIAGRISERLKRRGK